MADILSKRILEKLRSVYSPDADTITEQARQGSTGIMSDATRIRSDVEDSMQLTAQQALESVGSLMKKTMESRNEYESATMDYLEEQTDIQNEMDKEATEESIDLQAGLMVKSADATFDYTDQSGEVKKNSLYDISNKLTKDLMKDFDLTKEQAAAFVGNLAVESLDFKQLQEMKPLVKGSRGGFGFAQWTGDRRVAFEDWAEKNDLDPRSYEANYGYLKKELSSKDPVIGKIGVNTIDKLKQTDSIEEATTLVSDYFLRPGIPHLDRRKAKSKAVYSMIMEQ